MCGYKDAGKKRERRSYLAVNIGTDEAGRFWDADSKTEARRLRRVRETRVWRRDLMEGNV